MSSELTVYTTSWCPYCRALKRQLGELGLEFTEIDIDADAAAAQIVQSLNNGNQQDQQNNLPERKMHCFQRDSG